MSFLKYPTVKTLLSLLLAISLQAQSQGEKSLGQRRRELADRRAAQGIKTHDDPAGRMQWILEWYGGMPTVEHLRQKAELAQREFSRWESQFPGSTRLPAASIPGSTSAWRNLGPTSNLTSGSHPDIDSGLPGAVIADPTDPKILYVGSSGGGVYRTTNADQASYTWSNITDSLALTSANGSIAIGAMAMDPTDHNVLYFGLGDSDSSYAASGDAAGVGLFKTSNASGATPAWTLCGALGNTTHTRCILVLDANNLLVGGNDGLWRSTNGGTSFSRVTTGSGLLAGNDVWTVAKLDASNLIASAQTSGGTGSIWYSTNGGVDWTAANISAISGPRRISVTTAPLDPTFGTTNALGVYENSSGKIARGLIKSTNQGHTWTYTAAPTVSGGLFQGIGGGMTTDGSQGFYNHGLTVDPTNISNVFLGANMALYRTTNGGTSWTQLTHWYGDRHVYAHADWHKAAWYGAGTVNVRLYYANDGGLCVIKDPFLSSVPTGASAVASDTTFIDNTQNLNLATHLIYNIGSTNAVTPADSKFRITLGLQDNGTRVRQPATPGGNITGTDTVFEDKNGGDGFGTLIHPTNGDLMLASYTNATISKSTNGGNDGFAISASGISEAGGSGAPFVTRLASGDAAHPNTVYTFVNTKVYKSTDFGSTFSAMGTSGLTPGTIRNINASRSDANRVAVVANGGTGFITTNGGATWVAFGLFPGGAFSMSYVWFDTNTPTTLYAASVAVDFTANHLWKSSNNGSTWTAIDGGGFPFGVAVHVIQNDPADNTVLLAGTDFGVYRSSDSGSTWVRYGLNMPFVAVRDLYIAPDGSFIRAGTYGRGVWELGSVVVPVVVTTSPVLAMIPAGSSQVFSATVAYSTTNNTVNWTVSPVSGGIFSPTNTASGVNTTFTAGATPGAYTVRATSVEDGIRFGESAVTVTQACTPTSALTQNFDGVTAPALPAGWTTTTPLGTLAPWATTTLGSDTAPNAVYTPSSTTPSDNRLDSPAFSIPAGTVFAQVSFKHIYDFEPTYDGGVLEISINGGAFTDIIVAGGSFVSGGYTGVLDNNASANPLAGDSAWTGAQSTQGTVIVNLPAASFGQSNNKLRWRAGSDSGTAGTGWTVDTVNISACVPGAVATTHFTVAAYPNPTIAGASHTLTVTAKDAGNATDTAYTGTVHITSSDPAAGLPVNATLTSGVGTFSLTMNTVGTQSITATDTVTASITGSQAGIVVNPGAAATIVATNGTPQSTLVSTAFATALTATVRDSGSNLVPGASVTFAAPGAGASGTFGGGATVITNASGVATAPTFTANATAGSYAVTATAVGVVTPANFSLTNTLPVATHFLVTAYPTPTVSGVAHTFTVTAQDVGNATVTTYAGTVQITSSDPAAVLPANATLTSGVGTFSLTMNTAGTQSITANDTVTASITGSQAGIFVIPGAAATIVATSGTPQTAVISTAFATALTATLRDSGGNLVPGVSVTFAAPGSGASGVFGGIATVTTSASGVATAPTFTANATAGSYTVTATTAGVVTPANFSLTNGAAVATHFSVAAYPTPTISGAVHTFTVTAKDAGNATVPTYAGTVHITSSDPAAVLPVNATLTSGVGTFNLTMNTVGTQTITATDTVTASINGSQAGIVVNPGAAVTIVATSGTPQSALVSTAFATALTATVRDSGNNPVPSVSVTFAAPGAGASGTFGGIATVTTNASGVATAPTFTANATAGSYTVTATAAGVVTPANFSLTNTPAPVITISVSPTIATILTSGTVVLNGTVSTGTITWATSGGALNTATGPSVTYTPATTGTFTVTATATADTSKTATATINVKSKDQDVNGTVDVLDLAYLARYYGTSNFVADLDGQNGVDDADITIFLTGF